MADLSKEAVMAEIMRRQAQPEVQPASEGIIGKVLNFYRSGGVSANSTAGQLANREGYQRYAEQAVANGQQPLPFDQWASAQR